VNAEASAVAFASGNPASVQVSAPGGNSPSFNLVTIITELETPNVPGDANLAGDINQAAVGILLVPVGPGANVAPIACTSVVTPGGADPDSPYDYDVRTVTCTFNNVPVNVYSVIVTVNGGYYSGSGEHMVIVTDPSLGHVAGAGWINWPIPSAHPFRLGDKVLFGFNAKFRKNSNQALGNLLVIRQLSNGTYVRVLSSTLSGLAIGSATDGAGQFSWASFAGRASYEPFGGGPTVMNHDFVVYAEDRGPCNRPDKFWLTVENNGVIQSAVSIPAPAVANAVTLGAGRINVYRTGGSRAGRLGDDGDEVPAIDLSAFDLPVEFGLSNAQPSPFRGETSLKFQMPTGANARLEIYDVSGRAVARLVDGYLPAGHHQVSWKPTSAPGGVYFARFVAGGFTQTRRLLLLP
jgi:hypothetical protein